MKLPIKEFKELNINEDEGLHENDSDCDLHKDFDNLRINDSQLIERGPKRTERIRESKTNEPYKRCDTRKDSVDSGHYSDASTNSPSSLSNEGSYFIPFENTWTTNLVPYTTCAEKILTTTSKLNNTQNHSVDSGHYSDASTNSPPSLSNEGSSFVHFENTWTTNLVPYTTCAEKSVTTTSTLVYDTQKHSVNSGNYSDVSSTNSQSSLTNIFPFEKTWIENLVPYTTCAEETTTTSTHVYDTQKHSADSGNYSDVSSTNSQSSLTNIIPFENTWIENLVPYTTCAEKTAITTSTHVYDTQKHSADSGNYSDVSNTNSQSSLTNIIPFEKTWIENLVPYTTSTEKITSKKSAHVQYKNIENSIRNTHNTETPNLVSYKTENQKESGTISNHAKRKSNLEDLDTLINHAIDILTESCESVTTKDLLKERLNDDVMKIKWLDLAVFLNEDIYATDTEGLTSLNRLLTNNEDGEDIPESFYTIMEDYKQNPSKCKILLDSKDKILKSLKKLNQNTELLEKYFKVSTIVISMLYDFEKIK